MADMLHRSLIDRTTKKESPSGWFLFFVCISTSQSIAKPTPGWNKVTLLTAVRNSPCSCPFSVSLNPPLAALNSEPRPGSLLGATTNQKLSPLAGKVDTNECEWPKGVRLRDAKCREKFPFRHGLRRDTNAGWNMVVLLRGCYICAKIYELTLWLEQGRLTHCRS